MLIDTFSNRLQKALDMNGWKPIDLSNRTGLDKSLISNYLSGNYKAGQDNLTTLSEVLGVDETWLMGYDVPITVQKQDNNNLDENQILYSKYKDILSDEDKEIIRLIIEKAHKKIDMQLGDDK